MSPRPGLSQERVIDAAVDVVNEHGLQALTLARVAERLGVRTPSLYNHVAGLDDVRQRRTVRAVDLLGQRLQRAAVGRAGADALHAMADAYRRFRLHHPGPAGAPLPFSPCSTALLIPRTSGHVIAAAPRPEPRHPGRPETKVPGRPRRCAVAR